jgi:hypothetical protein
VPQALALEQKFLLLLHARADLLDLAQLEGDEIELALARTDLTLQLGELALELTHARMQRPHARASLRLGGAAERVEHVKLDAGQHQPAMLVLAVEGQHAAAQLSQVSDGRRAPADIGAGTPIGPHSTGQHQLLRICRQQRVLAGAQPPRQLEDALHIGLARALADDARASLASQQEVQGLSQQCLAGAGLAGQHVEPRAEPQLCPLHQQQVLDPDLTKHSTSSTRGGGQNLTNRRSSRVKLSAAGRTSGAAGRRS